MYKLVRLTLLTLACGAVPAVALAQGLPTSRADGEVLNGTRTVQAAARTDLSLGAHPDLAKPS